jgi:flagellin
MVINTNIAAENSAALLQTSSANLAKSLQRLSSGSKIISPADDAAGLAMSMQFTAESGRLQAASNNVSNAVSFTQTQDGFLQQVSTALNRMSQLAVSAQDATKSDSDRADYNAEFQQLASYIGSIATKDFNGVSLFASGAKAVTTDDNANTWSMAAIDLGSATYTAVTGNGGTILSVGTTAGAVSALQTVDAAITRLATDRATEGASLSYLNYTSNELSVQKTNIDAANSQISDVDVAQESTQYAKLNILVQSGTAMLAQANTLPQSVLKLITG